MYKSTEMNGAVSARQLAYSCADCNACQAGTDMYISISLQGRAAVLDVGPSSVLHTRLIMDGLQVRRHYFDIERC